MRIVSFYIRTLLLALTMVFSPTINLATAASEISSAAQCQVLISDALRTGGSRHAHLQADAQHPVAQAVLDLGSGCKIGTTLEFHSNGGRAVAQALRRPAVPGPRRFGGGPAAYPYPPSPATDAGTDPYCYQHSWQTDKFQAQVWAADIYQFWDNYEPCCPSLVNPYAVQQWVTDPFFVNTRNDYTDSWVNYAWWVQADGWADFYSSLGPTGDGVHHWIQAKSDVCGGDADFWGANVPDGFYHSVFNGPAF